MSIAFLNQPRRSSLLWSGTFARCHAICLRSIAKRRVDARQRKLAQSVGLRLAPEFSDKA